MIAGLGIDLQSEVPMRLPWTDPFFRRVFTGRERREAESRPDRTAYCAGRFAAKEALVKALGIDTNHVRLDEIETLWDDAGAPQLILSGALRELTVRRGITGILVSLSHSGDTAAAVVVLIAAEQKGEA